MKKTKVSVIGAGQVGATAAQRIVEKELADVVLVDVVKGLPQGKALDIMQSASIEGFSTKITGTNNYADIADSEVVIITAGFARKPGMSRDDLLQKNACVIREIAESILQFTPEAKLIVVTNPLDVMTQLLYKLTGFPRNRVMGMAGVLDTSRFKYFISEVMEVSPHDVETSVLGGHGDSMVPLLEYTRVAGVPLRKRLSQDECEKIVNRTRQGGAEIVSLLKTGSAYYAPSSSAVAMAAAILCDEKRIFPVSTLLQGEYGLEGVFCGVPVRLGGQGVEEIIELKLSPAEREALHHSAREVQKVLAKLGE